MNPSNDSPHGTPHAAATIAEGDARFRTLFENAPGAILVLDTESGRFIEANQRSCELLGLTPEQFRTMGVSEVSVPTQPNGADSLTRGNELIGKTLTRGETLVSNGSSAMPPATRWMWKSA